MEHCENPWNKNCNKQNIEVYIIVKGERRAICRLCWTKLAERDTEW